MNTSCPGLFHGMYLRGGEPWVEPVHAPHLDAPGDEQAATAEDFFELSSEDEQVLAEINAGKIPDLAADAIFFGPDDEEVEAGSHADDRLELPEADDEFDEDLSELVAEIDAEIEAEVGAAGFEPATSRV